jgi:hypothetical protein
VPVARDEELRCRMRTVEAAQGQRRQELSGYDRRGRSLGGTIGN